MKISKLLFIFIFIGIFSFLAIIKFYFVQRDFTQQQREFFLNINNLENAYLDASNLVLENSIYMYVDQDDVAHANKAIQNSYQILLTSKILSDDNYIEIKKSIVSLSKNLKQDVNNVEFFLRVNASIKNSLLFLSRHIDNSAVLAKANPKELLKARIILKSLNDTKKLQDLAYLKNKNYLLISTSEDKTVQRYIQSFNLHSNFLVKNYPAFMKITKQILDSKTTHNKIHRIKKEFSQIALNDLEALDEFASVLLSVFFLLFITIIILLVKYQRENLKLQAAYNSLEYSLTFDQLTEIYNRRRFEQDIKVIKNPSLLLVNINNFKYINDIYGNDVGNILLKDLTIFIISDISKSNKSSIYRLGGDEFGIVYQDIDDNLLLQIAEKLEISIANHVFIIKDLEIDITVSIAINSVRPILENADLTLKEIKKHPTINIVSYDESQHLKQDVEENMKIIQIIKEALIEDRIVPFFQPIINLQTLKIEKYEALVRLKLKDGTFLPPFKFLEIAQKSSQYNEITKVMIDKTIKIAQKYDKYRFSLNVSMRDISNKNIRDILFYALENKSADSKIDIELLESENLTDMQIVKEFITKVHSLGSKILIDDFGSGYSNFAYFSELDIDIVKIDGSIVKEIAKNERQFHMLKSIQEFANGMDMITVSEFVETKEIAQKLKDNGSIYAQGYYFSKPLEQPLDDDNVTI